MALLTKNEALKKIVDDIDNLPQSQGFHMFFFPEHNKFMVSKGSRNRGIIQKRIDERRGEYIGFYHTESFDPLYVFDDVEFISG